MSDQCTRCGAVPAEHDSPEIAPAVLCERCWDRSFGWPMVVTTLLLIGGASAGLVLAIVELWSVLR